jgi:hypothetical protein
MKKEEMPFFYIHSLNKNGKTVERNVRIPLIKSITVPEKYDLFRSLQEFYKNKYQFDRIGLVWQTSHYRYPRSQPSIERFRAFNGTNTSVLNLLSEKELTDYTESVNNREEPRRVIVTLLAPGEQQQVDSQFVYRCAQCQGEALLADMTLKESFCSEKCYDTFLKSQ